MEPTPRSKIQVSLSLLRTFGPFLRPYGRLFLLGYTAMALAVLLRAAAPFPLKWILDYVLLDKPLPGGSVGNVLAEFGGEAKGLLGLLCVLMVALVFFQSLASYTQKNALAIAARRSNNDVRNSLYQRLQILPMSFFGGATSGDLVLRLTDDINSLRKLLTSSMTEFVKVLFTFSVISILMLSIDVQLTLLALVIVPAIYFLATRFATRVHTVTRFGRAKESKVSALVQETVSSIALVQAFSQQDQEGERFAREADQSLRADLKRLQLSKSFSRTMDLMVALGTAAVVYYAGILALDGRLAATHLILFVPWLKDLYSPLEKLADLLVNFTRQLVSGERLAEILSADLVIGDADDAVTATPFEGAVRFDGVSFGYEEGQPVLHDVSFDVKPRQTVALVGPSGAGKSTVVNLLMRFFDPWTGRIEIDGQDIRTMRVDSLRGQIDVALQETPLLRRTVRENIAYGKPNSTPEEIKEAARAAQIHDFIESLPDGYDTLLEERASNLSGGERQRIGLARALLRRAPILILDEPVSQLDALTEARLSRAIAGLMEDRTTFVIAHRLATIQRADQILVLDGGRLVESGSHEQLLAKGTLYRTLFETQHAAAGAATAGGRGA